MSTLRFTRDAGLVTLTLDKPRGNAIDAALVADLRRAVEEIAGDPGIRGVLLRSAHPKLFSPGLDLQALVEWDRDAMRAFMQAFAETVWALFGLSRPVVAAVGGHAVAGGCILALTADYRVLRRGVRIGLNEVKVGVPLPWSVTLLLRATATPEALSKVALLGRNFQDDEALAAGLADEIAESAAFDATCRARLEEFAEKDPHALGTTKGYLRGELLARMKADEAARMDDFLDGWFSEATRERIRATVESLRRKG